MSWWDELIARVEAGERPELPQNIREKYQAYSGGQFPLLTIISLEKLIDRVEKLEQEVLK